MTEMAGAGPDRAGGSAMKPVPVGSIVDYHGSHGHGRYVRLAEME